MATGNHAHDDLYRHDGYEKVTHELLSNPEVRQLRQDSGVDSETMADAIHNEAVGTLFASQAAANVPLQATLRIVPREIVNMETHTQPGPESSIFARYDARAEQRRKDENQTISELRQWLERFKLPQEARVNDQGVLRVKNEASHHILLKRSLSAQAAEVLTSRFPSQGSAENLLIGDDESATHKSEDDDTDAISLDGRLNLLSSVALPLSQLKRTSTWEERRCVHEEYDSIERARAICVDIERRSAEDQERQLETSVKNWTEAEQMRKRTDSSWPDGDLEASVVLELKHGQYMYEEMSRMITFEDSSLYIIPRMWDFTDLPRRTRLYSNTYYLLQYLRRERSVVFLIQSRLEDLREGKSEQPEATVAEEIETLEDALELRSNAEEDYLNLLCDFLDWAIAHTTLEFRDSTNSGLKPTRGNALTDDIPLAIVEDVIEAEPELNNRYERLRDLEQSYFPERFIVKPLPPKQSQYTPRGRQIPVRQPAFAQNGSSDDKDFLSEPHVGEALTRTLPRSFKPRNTQLLKVKEFNPHPVPTLDRKMRGEPTSPMKPPETDYLRPPRPKRKLPLRMWDYPHKIEEYIPKPLVLFQRSKSSSAHMRHKFRTGLDIDEHTSRRLNPSGQFLSLQRVKRVRALQEPLTPDNIDKVVERNRREDLTDLHRRHYLAQYEVLRNYDQLMREFLSRASAHWVAPITSVYDQWYDEEDDDDHVSGGKGLLRIVNPEPCDDLRKVLDTDGFQRIEDQRFFDALGNINSVMRVEDPAVGVRDPAVRVVDFASHGNINSAQIMEPSQSIERINEIDDSRAKTLSPLVRKESVWWSPDTSQGHNKGLQITVTEFENSNPEEEEKEGLPAELVESFQRPPSRAEHRIEDRPTINVAEIESFGSDDETSHVPPEQAEPRASVEVGTSEAQNSFRVRVGMADTGTEETATEIGDDQIPRQHMDLVGRPLSRAQQIIERQPELTPKEIDSYDTEEEDLRSQSSSRMRRSNHVSRY